MRPILPFVILAAGLAIRGPLRAQTCSPLTVALAPNGAGCSTLGGAVPVLVAQYSTAGYHACQISFGIATPPAAAFAVLVVGASDPVLDLASVGLPGCVLRASLDVLLPMAYGVPYCGPGVPPSTCTGSFAQWVALPADPALAGSTVYFQAFGFSTGWPAPAGPMLSNGVSLGLF